MEELDNTKDDGIADDVVAPCSSLGSTVFDILPRLLDVGCKIAKQDGQWWIFEHDGEGVVCGDTFREMCEKLSGVDIEEHERRHLDQCRWYMENRDRLLGRR